MDAQSMLDAEFLEMRCRLLDLSASMDRMERAGGAAEDPRMGLLRKGMELLAEGGSDRAIRMQMLFSDAYEPNWMREFGLARPTGGG